MESIVLSQLYVESYGVGPPVVLVHGWGMHGGIWRKFAQQLSVDYQVICVDLPGHGFSDPITSFTLSAVANELAHQVPIKSACWVGWSLGANVVLELAQKFPEKVASIVLVAGNPCFTQAAAWPGMPVTDLDHFTDNAKQDIKRTIMRFLALQVGEVGSYRKNLSELNRQLKARPVADQATLMAGLTLLRNVDQRFMLSSLSVPHLLLFGDQDPIVPIALTQIIDESLTMINYSIVNGAGHLPFLTHESQVLAQFTSFLKKVNGLC